MRFDISYIGKVQSQQRPKHRIVTTKDGRIFSQTYDPKNSRDFKATMHLLAQTELIAEGKYQIEGPCVMTIHVFVPIPKSFSKKKRQQALDGIIRPTNKPDVDNLAKGVMDSLTGVLYTDDRLVVQISVYKFYREREGVDVTIQSLDAYGRIEE